MARVLYISYTGILDSLGQSQVLQYLKELAKEHAIALLTFESAGNLADSARVKRTMQECASAGIEWHYQVSSKAPGPLSAVIDIARGSRAAITIARATGAQIAHCRSYIGSLMGTRVKKATGAKFIFDMRGFWPDERVDAGVWSRSGAIYQTVKRLEKTLFQSADHVISLTRNGVGTFSQFDYLQDNPPPSSVIPTCTNLELFQPRAKSAGPFTLGYVGSVGSWYLFDQVAHAVAMLFEKDTEARFLVINKGRHDYIRDALKAAGVDLDRVEVLACDYTEVGKQVSRMHAGIFFIMAAWSKRASCPTRMGEFLASGVPCLANDGVGDVREDFESTGTGIVLPAKTDGTVDLTNLDKALDDLIALSQDPAISTKCRKAAEDLFALEKGVAEYDRIYQRLSGAREQAA